MRSPLDKVCQLWTSRVPKVNSPRMTIPTIYSACPVENPTRNHFGLTGAWSRVRSHMGSAYFSLPSAGAQPNMQKAQCRGQPGCALSTSPGMHEGILQWVVLPKKLIRMERAKAAQHLLVHPVAGGEVSPAVGKQLQLHLQLLNRS